MDLYMLRAFLLWFTIINGALLMLSFLACAHWGDWIYQMHRRWFPISREAFNIAIYSFIGWYKMFVLGFNLVPYLALVIVG